MNNFILILILFFLIASCEKKKEEIPEIKKVDIISSHEEITLVKFPYVAKANGKNSIYMYDISSKKSELIFYHPYDFVIALIPNYETNISFIITSRKVGTEGNFPSISRIKLFRVNEENNATDFIAEIGTGMQIYSYWNDDGNLMLIYTDVDKTIASYINKYEHVYNPFGKLIDDNVETFDITRDGFPELLRKKTSTVSKSGNYGISLADDSVYFKSAEIDSLKLITPEDGILINVEWSGDEQFMFFTTQQEISVDDAAQLSDTTGLFIYNIHGDSLTYKRKGAGTKNFFVTKDHLVFDDGVDKKSTIFVYNFIEAEMIDSFSQIGGAGLFNIPQSKKK